MNLSHKLTISIVSILLVTALAIAPTAIAEEGGPTATIEIDKSQAGDPDGPDDDPTTLDDNIPLVDTVDGDNILMTNKGRTDLRGTTGTGEIRFIVTFDQDVWKDWTETDQTSEAAGKGLDDGFRDATYKDVSKVVQQFKAYAIDGMEVDDLSYSVTRVDTDDDTDDIQPHKRKFLITVSIPESEANKAPFIIRVEIPENSVFSKASDQKLGSGGQIQNEVIAVGSQPTYADFTVIPKPLLRPTLGGDPHPGEYGIEKRITLTLSFSEAPGENDKPTRDTIKVTNGSILADDTETLTVMEGFSVNTAGTTWTITLVPSGGTGNLQYDLTVSNTLGAPFEFSRTYNIDSTPPNLVVNFDGTPVKGGGPFQITIKYTVPPTSRLGVEGITVEGGTKVSDSFDAISDTEYTIIVDPIDTTAGSPGGKLIIRVGPDSEEFDIPAPDAPDVVTPDDPDDPDDPIEITLAAGLDAGKYLVVTPSTITYAVPAAADGTGAVAGVNEDVLPESLAVSMRETQAKIPNLEDLLFGGGTIDVYVDVAAGVTPADIIINEVMWALDENEVGTDGETAHQWIELYNNSSTTSAAAGTITLWFKPRALTNVPTDKGELTDRLSNVERFGTTTGWKLGTNHGQNGNSHAESTKEFISMYRKADRRGDRDGINGANWLPSTEISHQKHRGTPGEVNTRSEVIVDVRPAPSKYTPPKNSVIINEVFNAPDKKNDWIELRALKTQRLLNWTLNVVTARGVETQILKFPDRTIPADDIWLIVPKQPTDPGVNLAPGNDVTISAAANQVGGRSDYKYWVLDFEIPNTNGGNYLIVLRSGGNKGSRSQMQDVVGPAHFPHKTLYENNPQHEPHTGSPGQIWDTEIWPINGWVGGAIRGHSAGGANNSNAYLQPDRKFAEGKAWARNGTHNGFLKDGGYHAGYRGGIGYDRITSKALAQGTPGYDNGAYQSKGANATGNVIITEIMYAHDGTTHGPPQWIELFNPSSNVAVNLGNFRLTITNHDKTVTPDGMMVNWERKGSIQTMLSGMSLAPRQTVLIVSARATQSLIGDRANGFPEHRIYNAFSANKGAFGMTVRGHAILNSYGFTIELHAKDGNAWQLSDSVGNLAARRTAASNEKSDTERYDDPRWSWPNPYTEESPPARISVTRTNTPGGTLATGFTRASGKEESGWILTNMDMRADRIGFYYYGHRTDISTAGQANRGQPLPVTLSFFRPTSENGKVTIQWTTESELDNAGFNILRSDTRDGEFKQVNAQMIQGKGTTAERSTYKWVDTTAKPGAVYYYQIEDVSFAGERNMLATTKLKGLISAPGKRTLRWGELKNLR